MQPRHTGTVREFDNRAGYGYVSPDDHRVVPSGELILVHRYCLKDKTSVLEVGDRVSFVLDSVPRGMLAADCEVLPPTEPDPIPPSAPSEGMSIAHELLSQALLRRDRRDYGEAARLYEKGLRECPTVQLVLSYAAM